jgi:hypothetical protein
VTPGLSIWLGHVPLASIQEVSQVLRAVQHAGSDSKEANAPGFTGAKKGDASDT